MNFKKILSKKWFFGNWPYIFIFVFFLYINFLSPPIGDDWEISGWFSRDASGNILTSIKSIYWNWGNFNGRGLSNFLMSYFCYYKTLWNFVSAGMFTFIIYIFSRLFQYRKNKISIILSIFFILSVADDIRMETYSLICANIAFIVPLVLILLYLKIIKKYLNNKEESNLKYKNSFLILIGLFCLVISTLMENISAGFTATLALLNFYIFLKTKKIDKLFLISFIFSLLGSIFMFTSPGMHAGRELYNDSFGLLGTLKMSLVNNINLIIFENKFIFFIIALITTIAVITNSIFISKKIVKYIYLTYLIFILFIFLIPAISHHFFIPLFLKPIYTFLNDISSIFLIKRFFPSFFWLIFLLSSLIPILYIKNNKNIYLFIYSIGILSLIPASLITQTGARIITITVFSFIGISCGIFSQLKPNSKKLNKIIFWTILSGILIRMNILSVMYLTINKTQKLRLKLTNNAILLQHQRLWNYDSDLLIIPAFKENTMQETANPPPLNTDFHNISFKKYFQLDLKTKVIFDNGFAYKNLSFNLEENNIAKIEIEPLDNKYNYIYYVFKNNANYFISTPSAQLIQKIKLSEPGKYSIKCDMIDGNNKINSAYSSDVIIIK